MNPAYINDCDLCDRCSNSYCRATVCLDDDPAALKACGHIACEACVTCDECEAA